MLNFITLQACTQQAASGSAEAGAAGGMSSWIMIIALIAIFYFFMIRPQSKKQKEIKKFRESLTTGSKVITAGGIYGTIKEIKDKYYLIEIDSKVVIRIDKGSVYPSPEDANEAIDRSENK